MVRLRSQFARIDLLGGRDMRLRDDRGIDKSRAVWYDARIIRKG